MENLIGYRNRKKTRKFDKNLSFALSSELLQSLEEKSKKLDISISSCIRLAVDSWINSK